MTTREEWEKKNPLRRWLDAHGRGLLNVSLDTGIPYERLAHLEQGLAVPDAEELQKLSRLLGDPDLEAKWDEWRRSEPGEHRRVITS